MIRLTAALTARAAERWAASVSFSFLVPTSHRVTLPSPLPAASVFPSASLLVT